MVGQSVNDECASLSETFSTKMKLGNTPTSASDDTRHQVPGETTERLDVAAEVYAEYVFKGEAGMGENLLTFQNYQTFLPSSFWSGEDWSNEEKNEWAANQARMNSQPWKTPIIPEPLSPIIWDYFHGLVYPIVEVKHSCTFFDLECTKCNVGTTLNCFPQSGPLLLITNKLQKQFQICAQNNPKICQLAADLSLRWREEVVKYYNENEVVEKWVKDLEKAFRQLPGYHD